MTVDVSGSYDLTYAAINLPLGLSIDSSSGAISGTVAWDSATTFGGVYNPTIVVVDGHGGSAPCVVYLDNHADYRFSQLVGHCLSNA